MRENAEPDLGVMEVIARHLGSLPTVNQYDLPDEPQSHTIAHGLVDIGASCQKIVDRHIPRLLAESCPAEDALDALHDIGEELRHILYHARDMKFYGYVFDPPE